ncbi:MAG: hypothetical protein HUU54_16120 [Ignavibacteriaceae bacterium]|nr:hypothetical protein [Ignavibacteriaceae bacterium]
MLAKNKIINLISTGFFLFINFLFLLKYSSRYVDNFILLTFVFLLIQLIFLVLIEKFVPDDFTLTAKTKYYLLLVPLAVFYGLILSYAPQETRVSRADAATLWLTDLLNGVFPYGTEKNPSGFPVNFLIIYPFSLAGNTGLLQFFTMLSLFFLLIRYSKSLKELLFRGFLILSSVPLYYELVVKSEIFSNAFLFLLLMFIILRKVSDEKWSASFFFSAILAGLLLSTRLVIFPMLLLFLLYKFRNSFPKILSFGLIAVIAFLLTLLPFIIWNSERFFSAGPFAVQSIYLPPVLMGVIIILSAYSGWAAANKYELFFSTGLMLFISIILSFLITVSDTGLYESLFNDRFDISYFNLCIPFFIAGIYEYKVDYFLGKIMPLGEEDQV